jgi:hypothetical protein
MGEPACCQSNDGYSPEELQKLEDVMMETLKGARSAEYYRAINTLGAMKSQAAHLAPAPDIEPHLTRRSSTLPHAGAHWNLFMESHRVGFVHRDVRVPCSRLVG